MQRLHAIGISITAHLIEDRAACRSPTVVTDACRSYKLTRFLIRWFGIERQ